jgi:hypothetical protein
MGHKPQFTKVLIQSAITALIKKRDPLRLDTVFNKIKAPKYAQLTHLPGVSLELRKGYVFESGGLRSPNSRYGFLAAVIDKVDVGDVLQRLMQRKIARDGNCLFRAIAHQLFGDENLHTIVRTSIVLFLRLNSDIFKQSISCGWEAYLEKMSKPSEWGGKATLLLCLLYSLLYCLS